MRLSTRRTNRSNQTVPLLLCLILTGAFSQAPLAAQECAAGYGAMAAWEVEEETPNGEHETFVDVRGLTLFERLESQDSLNNDLEDDATASESDQEPVDGHQATWSLSQLPLSLQPLIECLLDGGDVDSIQSESEWGYAVLAIEWRNSTGDRQELKALEDGTPLYLELAEATIPAAVRQRMSAESTVESMLLFMSPPVLDLIQVQADRRP